MSKAIRSTLIHVGLLAASSELSSVVSSFYTPFKIQTREFVKGFHYGQSILCCNHSCSPASHWQAAGILDHLRQSHCSGIVTSCPEIGLPNGAILSLQHASVPVSMVACSTNCSPQSSISCITASISSCRYLRSILSSSSYRVCHSEHHPQFLSGWS